MWMWQLDDDETIIVMIITVLLLFGGITYVFLSKDITYSTSINVPNSYNEGFINNEDNKLYGIWYTQEIIDDEEVSGLFYFYNNETGEVIITFLGKNEKYKGNFRYEYNETNGELLLYSGKNGKTISSYTINFLDNNTMSMLSENNHLEIYTKINTAVFNN